MQLTELLEEQSVKSISKQTMISEEDIERLTQGNFNALNRVKAFGFMSILVREYKVDLTDMRSDAEEFYGEFSEPSTYSAEFSLPSNEDNRGGFSLLWLFILLLIGAGYYVTQVDKSLIQKYLPAVEKLLTKVDTEKTNNAPEEVAAEKSAEAKNISTIEKVNVKKKSTHDLEATTNTLYGVEVDDNNDTKTKVEPIVKEDAIVKEDQVVNESITLIPKKRLWFGLIDTETKVRSHFSVSKPYTLELEGKTWLIATSIAAFTIRDIKSEYTYKNVKSNYFKVDKSGIIKISKAEYVVLGGYRRW
jgi:hypothetical protein